MGRKLVLVLIIEGIYPFLRETHSHSLKEELLILIGSKGKTVLKINDPHLSACKLNNIFLFDVSPTLLIRY